MRDKRMTLKRADELRSECLEQLREATDRHQIKWMESIQKRIVSLDRIVSQRYRGMN